MYTSDKLHEECGVFGVIADHRMRRVQRGDGVHERSGVSIPGALRPRAPGTGLPS